MADEPPPGTAPPVLRSVTDRLAVPAGVPLVRGKVRDVLGPPGGRAAQNFADTLLFVATDRLSAFDHVLPGGIPDKGRVLTALSRFWFDRLGVPDHRADATVGEWLAAAGVDVPPDLRADFEFRSMVVRAHRMVPVECVARGYLSGSGWAEYRERGTVCGVALPAGLRESERLPEPVFTPATKAVAGHDENVSFDAVVAAVGGPLGERLRAATLDLYRRAAAYAGSRGLILADTKFEFGLPPDAGDDPDRHEPVLCDEVLTPDSSRYWPADGYRPGGPQPSFDKQFVRDWLLASGWDRGGPPPALPAEVVAKTRDRYLEAQRRITGRPV